jgi:hypothetical protein
MEKKLRENAPWNVNKTIRCLVRNKIKHRKKYKIGKFPTPLGKISLSCTPPVLDSICLRSTKTVHLVDQVKSVVVLIGMFQKKTDRPSRSGEISSGVDRNVSEEQTQFIL